MDAWTVAFVVSVVLVAVTAQAVAGFGFALIAVPLLAAVLDVRDALVLATFISLVNTSILAVANRERVPLDIVGPMLGGAIGGMPAGLALLLLVPADGIRLLVGVTTIVLALAIASGVRFRGRSIVSELAAGVVSGALNTSTGMNGPPIVLYLQGQRLPPGEFRGALAAFFTACSVITLGMFAAARIVSVEAVALFAATLPSIALGSWAGQRLGERVPHESFRRLVYALLFVSAAAAVASAIIGLA